MYLGIDLGTTNSVVARSFPDSSITEVVRIGQLDEHDNWEINEKLPSMVYFTPEGKTVGEKAKALRDQDRKHVVTNAKRFMGTNEIWTMYGKDYKARDIGAIVLQHCKNVIEQGERKDYDAIVITVPASFTVAQTEDTIAAAILAGFARDKVIVKHEPTAALLSYIDEQSKRRDADRDVDFSTKKRVLVFDLGGGTCDTTIIDVRIKNDKVQFTELGIGRYQELGGIDFDRCFADKLLNEFLKDNDIRVGDLDEIDKAEMYRRLKLGAEKIKENLSSKIKNALMHDPECDIESISVGYNFPNFYRGNLHRLRISKHAYDEYTRELYIDEESNSRKIADADRKKNIIGVIRETLDTYHIDKNSIDLVFMTGGMSQFPTVREKVGEYVGKPIITPEDPMNAVAKGAAVYQIYAPTEIELDPTSNPTSDPTIDPTIDPSERAVKINDQMMLAESIMINVSEGLPRVIIPRGTKVPYDGALRGMFRTASPSGVNLDIYAGNDEFDSEMRIEKTLPLDFDSPVNPGTPFDIEYSIDKNKAITLKIVIDDSFHEPQNFLLSVYGDENIVERDYGLTTEC